MGALRLAYRCALQNLQVCLNALNSFGLGQK